MFVIGPNACGKSNFLDVFRFLRDIATTQGGGLQKAVNERGGLSKIRCLAARRAPDVKIEVHLKETGGATPWKYAIGIKQEVRGHRQPYLTYERVWQGDQQLLNRPDGADKKDPLRLTQTYLEQINTNQKFREIVKYFDSIRYLHLIPQLLRYPNAFVTQEMTGDPFGRQFLEPVAQTPERTRRSRLKKIEDALQVAVPQLKELIEIKDERGVPHLEAVYEHWRHRGIKQREDQFSDGTLRFIALLWSLLESDSLLLLEEPEWSLHSEIVRKLPALIYRMQRVKKRQVFLTTHDADLLADQGIGGEEVLLLNPSVEGTEVQVVSSVEEVKTLLDAGFSVAEAVLPQTVPPKIAQVDLFK